MSLSVTFCESPFMCTQSLVGGEAGGLKSEMLDFGKLKISRASKTKWKNQKFDENCEDHNAGFTLLYPARLSFKLSRSTRGGECCMWTMGSRFNGIRYETTKSLCPKIIDL